MEECLSQPGGSSDGGQTYCNSTWDTVSCWPTTLGGRMAVLPCPSEVDGIKYDTSRNATRMCSENGTWQFKSNYSDCSPLPMDDDDHSSIHNYVTRVIYYVGFTTSIVALVIALSIFFRFRSLKCLRNTIHCHLMITFVLRNVLWVVMDNVLPNLSEDESNELRQWVCKLMVTVYNYLQVSSFFWMLVEGLYLHTMIVYAFSIDKIRFWYYAVLGWCGPAVVVLIWAVIKAKFENDSCWLPIKDTYYDYVYITPVLVVLLVNLIFLASIVWILITKLRASNTDQTRQYRYVVTNKLRKAVKATLILFPLLGVTYVLLITPPGNDPISKKIFVYFNAVLQSTQGLAVSIFYCFLNGEVRNTIKNRFSRWQEGRSVATKYSRASIATTPEQLGMRASFQGNHAPPLVNGRNSIPRDYLKNPGGANGYLPSAVPMLKDEAL